jgi:probable HAF family extracellular repeat protein
LPLTLAAVALFVATVGAGAPKEFKFQTIDIPGADATFAMGINANGDIVGFYVVAGVRHGFTLSRGVVQTVDGPDPLTTNTLLFGISPNGTVTGFSNTSEPCVGCPAFIPYTSYGLVWRAGQFNLLQVPGNLYTGAYRVNARGDIVGETMDPSGKAYGFLRRGETMTMLDMSEDADDPMSWSSALGVNARGDIVGWYGNGTSFTFHGYLLKQGVKTTIDGPGSSFTLANAINEAGTIVGIYMDAGFAQHGFVWKDGQFDTFDVPGAVWTECDGINARGDIVGVYGSADGKVHGFVAYR